jgi:hypothetical protein
MKQVFSFAGRAIHFNLNCYQIYLNEGGEEAKNVTYALNRIERVKRYVF